ncbi:hypothetical protein QEN19_000779 [Hanseniaspora menglaensis]
MSYNKSLYVKEYNDIKLVSDTTKLLTFKGVLNSIIACKNGVFIIRVFDPSTTTNPDEIQMKQLTIFINSEITKQFIEDLKPDYTLGNDLTTYEVFQNNKLIFVDLSGQVRVTSKLKFIACSQFKILQMNDYVNFARTGQFFVSNTITKAIKQLCQWNENQLIKFCFDPFQNQLSETQLLIDYRDSFVANIETKYTEALRNESESDESYLDESDSIAETQSPTKKTEALTEKDSTIQKSIIPPMIELSPPSSSQNNYSPSPSPNKLNFNQDQGNNVAEKETDDFFNLNMPSHTLDTENIHFNEKSKIDHSKPALKRRLTNIDLVFEESEDSDSETSFSNQQNLPTGTTTTSHEPELKKLKKRATSDDSLQYFDALDQQSVIKSQTKDNNNKNEFKNNQLPKHSVNENLNIDLPGRSFSKNVISKFFSDLDSDALEAPLESKEFQEKIISQASFVPLKQAERVASIDGTADSPLVHASNHDIIDQNKIADKTRSSISNINERNYSSANPDETRGILIRSQSLDDSNLCSSEQAYSKEINIVHTGVQTNINFLAMDLIWKKTEIILAERSQSPNVSYLNNHETIPTHLKFLKKTHTDNTQLNLEYVPSAQNFKKVGNIHGALIRDSKKLKDIPNISSVLNVNDNDMGNILNEGIAIGSSPTKLMKVANNINENDAFFDDVEGESFVSNLSQPYLQRDVFIDINTEKDNINDISKNDANHLSKELIIMKNNRAEKFTSKIYSLVSGVGKVVEISCNVIGIFPLSPIIPKNKHSSFILKVVESTDYKNFISNKDDIEALIVDLEVTNTEALAKKLGLVPEEDLFKHVYSLLSVGLNKDVSLKIRRQKNNSFQWSFRQKFDKSLTKVFNAAKPKADIKLAKSLTISDLNSKNFGTHDFYLNIVALRIKKGGSGARLLVTDFLNFSTCEQISQQHITSLNGHNLSAVREVFVKDNFTFKKLVDEINAITGLTIDSDLKNGGIESKYFIDYPLEKYGVFGKLSGWTKEFKGSIDLRFNRIVFLSRDKTIDGPVEEMKKLEDLYERYDSLTDQEFLQNNYVNLVKFLPYEKNEEGDIILQTGNMENDEAINYANVIEQFKNGEQDELLSDEEIFDVGSIDELNQNINNEFNLYKIENVQIINIRYFSERCLELLLMKGDETVKIYLLHEKNVNLMFLEGTAGKASTEPIYETLSRIVYPLTLRPPVFVTPRLIEFQSDGFTLKAWEMIGFDKLWLA